MSYKQPQAASGNLAIAECHIFMLQLDLDGQFFSSNELRDAANFRTTMQPHRITDQTEFSSIASRDSVPSPSLIRKRVRRNVVNIEDLPQPEEDIDIVNSSHNCK